MKKVNYAVLGVIIAIVITVLLLRGIPDLLTPDISKNIQYLDELEVDSYVDLSDVVTMIGYQVYPNDIQERLANEEFAYGRSNPMYFVQIKVEEPKDDSSGSGDGDKGNNSRRSGYYVYPYGGKAYYTKETPMKIGSYVDIVNREYSNIEDGKLRGYEKVTSEMKDVQIEGIIEKVLKEGHLPVDEEYLTISSRFGIRIDPFDYSVGSREDTKILPFHTGLDIAHPGINGTNVYNMVDGEVKSISKSNTGYGNLVVIDTGEFDVYYAHLESIDEEMKEGKVVKAGETIGKVGNTGRSTGPHLHIEIDFDGIVVNPELFIPKESMKDMITPERPTSIKEDKNGVIEFQFDELRDTSYYQKRKGGSPIWT